MPRSSEEWLELALHIRRMAESVSGYDPIAARDLERIAFNYLDLAETAQRQENAGKLILGR